MHVAPVYELRVPLDAGELAERRAFEQCLSPAQTTPAPRIVYPPQVSPTTEIKSSSDGDVDKNEGRPPGGSETRHGGVCEHTAPSEQGTAGAHPAAEPPARASEREKKLRRRSKTQRVAYLLLHSLLHPDLCEGVSERWLSSVIHGTRLLDHNWSVEDFADACHGQPEYRHLAREIRSARAFIRARLSKAAADPLGSQPSLLRAIDEVQNTATAERNAARRAAGLPARPTRAETWAAHEQAQRAAAAEQRRSAIADCAMCDEQGWYEVTGMPVVRCTHDPDSPW